MDSNRKLDNLYRKMEELTDSFQFLGDNCSKEAEKLKNSGMPPDPHFIKELENAAEKFNYIRSELEQAAVEFSWNGFNGHANSISKLQEFWSGLREHLSGQSTEADSAGLYADGSHEKPELDSATLPVVAKHNKFELTGGIRSADKPEKTEADRPHIFATSVAAEYPADDEYETFGVSGDLRARYPELLYNLIEEEKLGPAFWLACYYEQNFGTAPVPSWLIKAAEIASAVQGEGGPASKWLSYLYKNYNFHALSIDEELSRRTALNLLAYSALLRPAFLAPGSGAAAILENLDDLPGTLKTLAASVKGFSGTETEGAARRDIDILCSEVKVWKKQNRKLTLASPVASKIWDKMQNGEGFLSRLLTPIEENAKEELENIRELFNYLREKENLKKEIRKLYQDMPELQDNVEIFHVPGSWQVINRMKSALKLVERWIKLHENTDGMVGMEENPLIKRLSESLVSAGRELDGLPWQYQGDAFVKAGAAACTRAIDSLKRLLDEEMDTIFSLTTDDVASLETGNNPQLLLKHNWKPQNKTVEKMGKALLELLEEMPLRKIEKKERKIDSSAGVIPSVSPSYNRSQDEVPRPIRPDLDKLCRNEILTAQEREFIRDTLKSLNS
ncbi:MAG: hypothetical protein Q7J85_01300 [Bacillota bacterium]|nr:hypothetical protein [Bacillota bacterium]